MQQLQGRVVVITGAASGIGLALAQRFAREGMKLVLADIETAPLQRARADRFYIVPAQPQFVDMVRLRLQDMLEGRNPTLPPSR
jgi:NAD(P)-dependent dehydrogenase (short-subunit alcohol dehydrogenase family)